MPFLFLNSKTNSIRINFARVISYYIIDSGLTYIQMTDGDDVAVDETPEQIDSMLRFSGVKVEGMNR